MNGMNNAFHKPLRQYYNELQFNFLSDDLSS